MSIDTRTKRQNVAQVGCPLPVSVLPSGTIGAAARAQISWSYGGITIAPPAKVSSEARTRIGTIYGEVIAVTQADIGGGGF